MFEIPESVQRFFEENRCFKVKPNAIVTRCPVCGDSRKHLYNHGHLYLYFDSGFGKCFRCGKFAPVRFFLQLIAKGKPIPIEVLQLFAQQSVRFKLQTFQKAHDVVISKELTDAQIEYLQRRVPHIPVEKYDELSIVNSEEYFGPNYIGFLTFFKRKLIGRAIDSAARIRYRTKKLSEGFDFYAYHLSLENFIKYKTIILAEGIFDILSKFAYNLPYPKIATLGKNAIFSTIKILFVLYGIRFNLIFLRDKDYDYTDLMNYASQYCQTLRIYENAFGKDFGEPHVDPILVCEKKFV